MNFAKAKNECRKNKLLIFLKKVPNKIFKSWLNNEWLNF